MKTTLTTYSIPILAIISLSIITLSLVPSDARARSAEIGAALTNTVTYGFRLYKLAETYQADQLSRKPDERAI